MMGDKGIKGWIIDANGKTRSVKLKAIPSGDSDSLYVLETTAKLEGGDIELGALEVKNYNTDDRALVDTDHYLGVKQKPSTAYQGVKLTTAGTAKIDLSLSGISLAKGFGFVLTGGDGWIAFDKDATKTTPGSIPLKDGDAFNDNKNYQFSSKISLIRDAGVDVTLRGVIFGEP